MLSGKAQNFAGGTGDVLGIGRAGAVENVRTRITIALSPDLKTWYPPREVLVPDAQDDAEQMFFDHMTMEPYGNQGHLISREVKITGPRLLVNCSAQMRNFSRVWDGSLHTELVERTGRAIEGYTYADCDANHVDDLAVPITWDGKDLSALMGRSLHIRFFMRNMFVFGFRFGEAV